MKRKHEKSTAYMAETIQSMVLGHQENLGTLNSSTSRRAFLNHEANIKYWTFCSPKDYLDPSYPLWHGKQE